MTLTFNKLLIIVALVMAVLASLAFGGVISWSILTADALFAGALSAFLLSLLL